ncbi:NAD(P)/FAD-dependent oxidoreductase [Rhizobium tubonense]|uniref:FAD-dependent oxidoreductase n=1 Tax=Rhizobium tubonense TaxID=484088 RepID=A0A2W4DM93_9HYPH|nr:FAD-dependent oxidoreductase [Rhizobium tubonense]PZM17134.1 FAD-dependent oxidoreductase [Rhizobium tubonense]
MPTDLPLQDTDQGELVSGRSPWGRTALHPWYNPLHESASFDVAIVGGGITGSLVAEHLTARGLSVCVLDSEKPGLGSTSASTAMLQWEIDTQLSELSLYYGFDKAAAIYRRSLVAVSGLAKLIQRHDIHCGLRPRSTLYLTSNAGGARELQREMAFRDRAGLPGEFLSHPYLMTEFEIERDGGILSSGAAEADPLLLSWGLLAVAVKRGAYLTNASATQLHAEGARVVIETDTRHVIEAKHVVLATGYSMPGLPMPKLHHATSSWALATVPQDPATLWRDRVLMWEDSRPYLYMRTSTDNRIIVGGEDDDTTDAGVRDGKMPEKIETLRHKLQLLWPQADTTVDYRWCGTFGETADGLPLIGPVPDMPRVLAAYGYGGNGITFSFMAALMIGAMISDTRRDWFDDFALDRETPAFKTFSAGSDCHASGASF